MSFAGLEPPSSAGQPNTATSIPTCFFQSLEPRYTNDSMEQSTVSITSVRRLPRSLWDVPLSCTIVGRSRTRIVRVFDLGARSQGLMRPLSGALRNGALQGYVTYAHSITKSASHTASTYNTGRSRIMDAMLRLIAGEQSPPLPDADARFRIFLVDLLGQRIALHPQHQNFHHRRPVSSAMLKRNYTTTRSVSF